MRKLKVGKLYHLRMNHNFLVAWKNSPDDATKKIFFENILFYVRAQNYIRRGNWIYHIFLDRDGDELWLNEWETTYLKEVTK